jgi:hypothetical protein
MKGKVCEDACGICGERVDAFDFAYMVTDTVWANAGLVRGNIAHLACLSAVLGRSLEIGDFPDVPCNRILRFGFRMGLQAGLRAARKGERHEAQG